VAEWRCFVAAGGYDPSAAHWQQAGPAALRWLHAALAREARYRPPALDHAQWGQALNPVTSITVYEAMAYAAWAAPMYTASVPGIGRCQPVLRPPTEVEWEAAQRAQGDGRPAGHAGHWVQRSAGTPDPMAFNHAATGWQQPSPVGVFSRAYSAAGLADGQGNVWEWCLNSLPSGPSSYDSPAGRAEAQAGWDAGPLTIPRAVRGGAFHALAWDCRPANRSCANAEDGGSDIGLRLVQVWPGQAI
jgi:formylglycine-generating enzyme required for sulfatase activity